MNTGGENDEGRGFAEAGMAEAERNDSDQLRRLAEEAREVRDRHREALETIRQERERLRENAETARAASEDARIAAEAARTAGEDARIATDAAREEGSRMAIESSAPAFVHSASVEPLLPVVRAVDAAFEERWVQHPAGIGAFQFVILASVRAVQLTRGCRPRIDGAHMNTVIAQLEVSRGKVVQRAVPPGLLRDAFVEV